MTFDTIVKQHEGDIHRVLGAHRVARKDRDEVCQEVLLAIHRGLPTFDPTRAVNVAAALRCWIYGICVRQAACYRRRMRKRREREHLRGADELDHFDGGAPSPDQQMMVCERREALHVALSALSPFHREFLLAHEIEGASIPDLAEAYRIPVNTAWNHLHVARQALRAAWNKQLRQNGGGGAAGTSGASSRAGGRP